MLDECMPKQFLGVDENIQLAPARPALPRAFSVVDRKPYEFSRTGGGMASVC